jgi:hypothetical protein
MAIPMNIRLTAALGNRCGAGYAGWKSHTVKTQAEIMNKASSSPSKTYSGQLRWNAPRSGLNRT